MSPVPPIRTKAPSNSPQSSTARQSSRFTERFTSPTTTRIVDELLDEVVAHRLTPRDTSGEALSRQVLHGISMHEHQSGRIRTASPAHGIG